MTERFKLVNKSRINNNRVRLIKTGTSTSQLDPLFGAIYENESEIGLCLSPSNIISCVGAKVESEEIVLDGDGWVVEVDGVVVGLPVTFASTSTSSVTYDAMVTLLEEHGIRVTELKNAVIQPIYCDGAVSKEACKMQDGGWMLEVDGVDMGGPYDLASLDEYSRRREVRILVPPPLVCDIESSDAFYFSDFDPFTLKAIVDAETGQVVMSSDDAFASMFNNDKVRWEFDSNYGRGSIRNLTDKCLLIYFQKWEDLGDADINAHITYEPDNNATVLEVDGLYYISLGPVTYATPRLDFYLNDTNGRVNNTTGGQAGEVSIELELFADGPIHPDGVTVRYGEDEQVLMVGDWASFPVERIQPNTSLSENVYVLRNDFEVVTPGVQVNIPGTWDYDLWQPTNYWDEYADRNDLQITITVNDIATIFTGSRSQMDHADMQRPSASIGTLMKIQAEAKWVGCAVQIGGTLVDGAIMDSNGYVEFIIPTITTGLWDVELINLDRIDEREFPSQNPVTRLRTVNFI